MKDGIVLAVEKLIHSKLLIPEANRRIQSVDKHIGMVGFLRIGYLMPLLNIAPV